MLREQAKLITRISFVINLLVIVAAAILAYLLWVRFQPGLNLAGHYAWTLLIILPVWLYLLSRYQIFSSLRFLGPLELCQRLGTVHLWGGTILAAAIFFIDRLAFSRGLYATFLICSFLALVILHLARRLFLGFLRRRGMNFRRLLIVDDGDCNCSRRFVELIQAHADWGLRLEGYLQSGRLPPQQQICGYPVLGRIDDLLDVCKRNTVDEVIFCLPLTRFAEAEEHIAALQEMGTTTRMVLDLSDVGRSRHELSMFHDELPILTFHTKSLDAQQLFLKRILDLIGAAVGLIIAGAMFPFIVLAIKLDSKGPVFFGQDRIGLNGRIFKCWKFRSMTVDAEQRKHELNERNEMRGAIFKISDDPRITRVGRFLRKSSLDEFPQFWNVLKGDMSLVGTRPPTPDEVANYENWHRRRISIKPGITGLWQVSGRNLISDFDEIVRLDIRYIESWNLLLDIRILLKTLWVLLARHGAS